MREAGIEQARIKTEEDLQKALKLAADARKQESEDQFLWMLKHQADEDEELHHTEVTAINDMNIRAEKKFKSLDVDENGFLEGDEIVEAAMWIWSSYNEGKTLTPEQRRVEGEKLLQRHDDNNDGKMDLAEFTSYFEKVWHRVPRDTLESDRKPHLKPHPDWRPPHP